MTTHAGDFISNEYIQYPREGSDASGNQVLTTKIESPTLIDEVSSSEIYLGYAVAGTSANDSSWKIKQIKQVGTIWTQKYPNGDENYIYKWADRTTLTYL